MKAEEARQRIEAAGFHVEINHPAWCKVVWTGRQEDLVDLAALLTPPGTLDGETLADAVEQALKDYRCLYTVDDDGDGLPLVDAGDAFEIEESRIAEASPELREAFVAPSDPEPLIPPGTAAEVQPALQVQPPAPVTQNTQAAVAVPVYVRRHMTRAGYWVAAVDDRAARGEGETPEAAKTALLAALRMPAPATVTIPVEVAQQLLSILRGRLITQTEREAMTTIFAAALGEGEQP